MLHLCLSLGQAADKTAAHSQGPGPPFLTLTPNSLPGLRSTALAQSSWAVEAWHSQRPVWADGGPGEEQEQGQEPDPTPGTQARLALSCPPRLSLSLNFSTSRTSRVRHPLSSLLPHSSVLGMGWALPEGIRGSPLTQDLEGDFGAALRPVSGMLQGSGTPGGRTQIHWTEMSKLSSSLGGLFLQGGHHCPWTLDAEMPLRSCGAAVVQSCGRLCSSVPEPGSHPWCQAFPLWGPRVPGG